VAPVIWIYKLGETIRAHGDIRRDFRVLIFAGHADTNPKVTLAFNLQWSDM
jgi:hypothetical protein